jgi:4-diphosphocytidyl-2C-methyl-D-erythritol kinase
MALGWGRGEKLLKLSPLPSRDVHLFLPPYGIDTGEAYALLDQARGDEAATKPNLTAEMLADWESAARNSVNEFEPVMRSRHTEIDTLLERGERYGLLYRMSGSGSTVFKIPGITTRTLGSRTPPPRLIVPRGTKRIITRTAESVVPVEILD